MKCDVAWRPPPTSIAVPTSTNSGDRFLFDGVSPGDFGDQFEAASSGELTPGADEDIQSPLPLQHPVGVHPGRQLDDEDDDGVLFPHPEPIVGYELARYHRNSQYISTFIAF